MTYSPTHSPLPWRRITGDIVDNNSNLICDFVPDVDNSRFIVKCVNNHDVLVSALKDIIQCDSGTMARKIAHAALKQMDGE